MTSRFGPGTSSSTTIDLGTVVSDVEKSVKWYKDVIGFQEQDGFDVPADFAGEVGLTNKLPFHVHVLVLGDGPTATKLKLMQFKTSPGARVDQNFIHSTYGFRYLTIFVNDLNAAVDEARMDDRVRAVVVTGEGRGWCAGADLQAMGSGGGGARMPGSLPTTRT